MTVALPDSNWKAISTALDRSSGTVSSFSLNFGSDKLDRLTGVLSPLTEYDLPEHDGLWSGEMPGEQCDAVGVSRGRSLQEITENLLSLAPQRVY